MYSSFVTCTALAVLHNYIISLWILDRNIERALYSRSNVVKPLWDPGLATKWKKGEA